MKKLLVLCLSVLLLLSVGGCGRQPDVPPVPEVSPTNPWGLTLTATAVFPEGIDLVIQRAGDAITGELSYGSPYWVEKKEADGWKAVPYVTNQTVAWTDLAYPLEPDSTLTLPIYWLSLYGYLEPGTYRLVKSFSLRPAEGAVDTLALAAEFVIA